MKLKIGVKILALVLMLGGISSVALANQNKNILWDFRKNDSAPAQKFSKAETDAVLKYLLGSGWDTDFAITSRVSGSFTKANAKETLYYFNGCTEEGVFKPISSCPHVSWHSSGWIAVYDGTKPVAKISEPLGYDIIKVTDLNGDGINEILSESGYGGQGIISNYAEFGQIEGGKYRKLKGFEGYVDNCGNEGGIRKSVATVISYSASRAGKMPVFTTEYYEAKCGQKSPWKKITKKRYDAFAGNNT